MSDPEIIGPNDKFDDPFADEPFAEPNTGMSRRAKLFAGGAILIGLVSVVVVGWFAFQQGIRSGAEEAAPVVRAASEAFKRKPDEPGGLDVPHQDKLVFNRLAPGQVQEPVERLLPPPEEPTERPPAPAVTEPMPAAPPQQVTAPPSDLPERVVAATPPPSAVPEPAAEPAPPPPPAPPVATSKPAEVAAAPPAVPAPFVREAEPQAAPKPAAAPKSAASAGKGWKIQLAAVSSEAAAKSEWSGMKAKNSDLLGSLALNIQTIKLDRGTFYRIQAGPLANADAARALCGKLKARSQDCLIVAP